MANDLASWLLEQIAADEQVARAAISEGKPYFAVKGWASFDADLGDYVMFDWPPGSGEAPDVSLPARVLAECEAKRRIIELHDRPHECSTYDHNGDIDNCTWVLQSEDCSTVRLLALPYADRPGYDESWRP
jgi:hypothetical protein